VITALSKSYNLPTARLGLDLGVPAVVETLNHLGVERAMNPFPSLLLGAVELNPLEVAQMYHTLASGGFRTPLRAIRAVMTAKGEPLSRYPLSVEKMFNASHIYLINAALKNVVKNGTGQGVYRSVRPSLVVAGKTGTSDDLRDSWFAGYTGDKLGIVWVGMDNNSPMGLTGGTGALRVWADIFKAVRAESAIDVQPEDVELVSIDPESGLLADSHCADALQLPFINGSAPQQAAPCAAGYIEPPAMPGIEGEETGDDSDNTEQSKGGFFSNLFR
jgi:penicillin-binding protein 1B